MSFNEYNEHQKQTLRSYASAVFTNLQTGTFAVNCGGANFGGLAIRTTKGNASQMWVRPQYSSNGTTWYDIASQTRTGVSVLATPIQYKITTSGYMLIGLRGIFGRMIRVKTQAKTLGTGCFIGVDLWLDRK